MYYFKIILTVILDITIIQKLKIVGYRYFES
jgi:hypothetical protein